MQDGFGFYGNRGEARFFHRLDEEEDKYDGIWACYSIYFHLPIDELKEVFSKMAKALRDRVLYMPLLNMENLRESGMEDILRI